MPSVDDVFNQLLEANQRLNAVVTMEAYMAQALHQNSQQNETIICLLAQISEHTCGIWNESHVQTGLQTSIDGHTTELAELYETAHAEAALERERLGKLRAQIEECCPPPEPEPVCTPRDCPSPKKLPEPPRIPPIVRDHRG